MRNNDVAMKLYELIMGMLLVGQHEIKRRRFGWKRRNSVAPTGSRLYRRLITGVLDEQIEA